MTLNKLLLLALFILTDQLSLRSIDSVSQGRVKGPDGFDELLWKEVTGQSILEYA